MLVNSRSIPKSLSLAQLKAGVVAAGGITVSRGDVLSFSAVAMKTPTSTALAPAKKSSLTTMLKPGIALFLVLLVLLLLWRASRKARKAALASNAVLDSIVLDRLQSTTFTGEPTGELPAVPYLAIPASPTPTIQAMVDAQSEEVASVLRDWLHQGV